ncbi:MAG: class I SAM-dependent methyltransferase [Thermoplasmatota archaeon]
MERAPNAWDRFYRYQVAPWRGERDFGPAKPFLRGRVLELGCGNGKSLKSLRHLGLDAVGLDVSFNVLERLGEGVLANATHLPFAHDTFDTVLDIHCCGHLPRAGREQAIAEQLRVLRPGGHLVVERLGSLDLRATKGTALEPQFLQLEDGRCTHFPTQDELHGEYGGDWTVVHAESTKRTPLLRGQKVTRESHLLVLQRT